MTPAMVRGHTGIPWGDHLFRNAFHQSLDFTSKERQHSPVGRRIMLSELNVGQFSPYVNSPFRLQAGPSEVVVIELVEARRLGYDSVPAGTTPRREPFSLIFKGPAQPRIEQGTYPVEHDVMEPIALFLVPVMPDPTDGRPRYEAIFT
jgi:hypothetical protein